MAEIRKNWLKFNGSSWDKYLPYTKADIVEFENQVSINGIDVDNVDEAITTIESQKLNVDTVATSSTLGLIKIGYSETAGVKKYAIKLDANNKAYVEVPWTDNNDNYYHSSGSWSGLTYTATNNGGASCPNLAFTIPTGTTADTVAVGNHTHSYLPLSGGTLSSTDANILSLKRTSSSGGAAILFYNNNQTNNRWQLAMESGNDYTFKYNTVEKLRLTPDGQVKLSGELILENTKALNGKTTNGTTSNIVNVNSSNNLSIGSSNFGYIVSQNNILPGSALTNGSLGASDRPWYAIYGTTLYENGTSLSDKYAAKSHTHNYAGSSSAGGPANSVANKLTLGNNNGVAYEYDGSSAKTVHFLTGLATTVNAGGTLEVSVNLSASDIPNLPASKITSGTFSDTYIASASTWNAKMSNPLTTTGDIVYAKDNNGTPERLGIGSNGKILKVVSGKPSWETEYSYTLPIASNTTLGGVYTYYSTPSTDPSVNAVQTTSGRYYGIQVNSEGKMFVNVPWTDSGNTNYYHSTGSWSGLTYTATNNGGNSCPDLAFTIPTGNTSTTVSAGNHTHSTSISVGGSGTAFSLNYGTKYTLTTGGTEFVFQMPSSDNTNYYHTPVYTSSTNSLKLGTGTGVSDMYIPQATSSSYGVIKIGYTSANKNYKVDLDSSGNAYVNVPWENTTYGGDRGISLVSGNFGHSNTSITAQTTQGLYPIKIDSYGHITAYGSAVTKLENPEAFTFGTYGTGSQSEAYDGYAAMSLKFDINCFDTEWTDDVDMTVSLVSISQSKIDALFS